MHSGVAERFCPTVAGAAAGRGRCGGWGQDTSRAPIAGRPVWSPCPGCLPEEGQWDPERFGTDRGRCEGA